MAKSVHGASSATLPAARRLLALLNDGSITKADYDTIFVDLKDLDDTPSAVADDAPPTTSISDSITIEYKRREPTYNELSVAARVLNIAELLEMILLYLPRYSIISKASRVCKGFNNAIEASPKLMRKVFRAPDLTAIEPDFLLDEGMEPLPRFRGIDSFTHESGERTVQMFESLTTQEIQELTAKSSTLRRTLLMQPPPKSLYIRILCRSQGMIGFVERVEREAATFGELSRVVDGLEAEYGGDGELVYFIWCMLPKQCMDDSFPA